MGGLTGGLPIWHEQEALMTYSFSKTANLRFDDALALFKEALERHDFDVTAEIDVKDIFKKRLNIDFRSTGSWRYAIRNSAIERSRRRTKYRCSPATLFCS